MKLVDSFPYDTPRQAQRDVLDTLESNWAKYDVFVISVPTAGGKTALARTLMNHFRSVSTITPTNLLVQQFLDEFPDTPTLARLDSYWCDKWQRPCPVTRGKLREFCSMRRDGCKCPASGDLSTALYRQGPGIYNYHTYMAHRLYRNVLVVDEAHNLLPTIRDRLVERIWQHDYKYPSNMYSYEDIQTWISRLPPNKQKNKKIRLLREATRFQVPTHIVNRTTAEFNGKGTIRGQPEERDCLELLPVDISDAPPFMWPSEVQKIVLMSATIGRKDVEQLGLTNRRILYIDCHSPIPAEQRPIVSLNTTSVNRYSMVHGAVEQLAEEINGIAEYHTGEKGVVHASYQLAGLLRTHLVGDRYVFHTKYDKADKYQYFRDSDPAEGKVFVACGLYEGIDLPEDLGRWQVISKVPWQSLANPAIKHLSELDPEWYNWETMKTTIQACGRICRTPNDYGITYVLDTTFSRLLEQGDHLIPQWFRDALE